LPIANVAENKQREFLDRFRDYMKPGAPERPLAALVESLPKVEVSPCIDEYFNEDKDLQQRKRSAKVFLWLALRYASISKYSALHVEAFMRKRRNPWQTHYAELSPPDKERLDRAISRGKSTLTTDERKFIQMFASYMTDRKVTQQSLQKLLEEISRRDKKRNSNDGISGCLQAYVEVSEGYENGNEPESLLIFFGLSFYALQNGGAYYAGVYEANVGLVGSIWYKHYTSLRDDFQSKLKSQVKDAKTLRADLRVDDADLPGFSVTHKDVPSGTAKVDASPTAAVENTGSQEPSSVQTAFLKLYRTFVDSKGDAKPLDSLQKFLEAQSFNNASLCVRMYLDDSTTHYRGAPTDESVRVFYEVVSNALKNSEGSYYAFKVKFLVAKDGTTWSDRYNAPAGAKYRVRLAALIDEQIRKKGSLIDDVKAAYFLKYQRDPDVQALRAFEPVTIDEEVGSELSKALSDCEIAVATRNQDAYSKAFAAVSKVLREQKDPLALLVLVKRCRDRREIGRRFQDLIHLYGVGLLFVFAVNKYPEKYYKKGFTPEEKQWLLEGSETANRYFNDFAVILEYSMSNNAGPDSYFTMSQNYALAQLSADQLRLRLTPLLEAATLRGAVDEVWAKKEAEALKVRVPIQGALSGKHELRLGQRFESQTSEKIGKFFLLWWDDRNDVVYLQVDGMDSIVFETDRARLAQLYDDDSFYGTLARNTEHLLTLIPFFYEIMGFLPDLVSGGLTGLIKSVAFNYAFDKSVEVLGINPTAVQLVMLGAGLLSHHIQARSAKAKGKIQGPDLEIDELVHQSGSPGTEHKMLDNTATGIKGQEYANLTGGGSHVAEAPLASREGVDMRGKDLGDGRVGVGLHDERAPPAAGETARAEQGAANSNISDTDRGLGTSERLGSSESHIASPARGTSVPGHGRTYPELTERQLAQIAAGQEAETLLFTHEVVEVEEVAQSEMRMQASARGVPNRRVAASKRRMSYESGRASNSGARYEIGRPEQDVAKFNESVHSGYHVYVYSDKNGKLLYVGKSGGVNGHADWVQRLQQSHMETDWIKNAKSVTVYYELTDQEMWALEETLIGKVPSPQLASNLGHSFANIDPGHFTGAYGTDDIALYAFHAMKKPRARFTFKALPGT
jgi:hypothetical protein